MGIVEAEWDPQRDTAPIQRLEPIVERPEVNCKLENLRTMGQESVYRIESPMERMEVMAEKKRRGIRYFEILNNQYIKNLFWVWVED